MVNHYVVTHNNTQWHEGSFVGTTKRSRQGRTVRRPHRSKEAFGDDPFVTFRADRLRAAIKHNRTTVNALARAVRVSQQRLDHITRGRNKRCRRTLLVRIGEVLGVPLVWLTGDWSALPYAFYNVDPPDEWEAPPLALLAQSRFGHKCDAAFRRDLGGLERSDDPERAYARLRDAFHGAMHDLINPKRWRRELSASRDLLAPGPIREDRDAATAALEAAFSIILRPWLEGEAALNYGFLREWGGPHTYPGTPTETTPLALGQAGSRDRRQVGLGNLENVVRALLDDRGCVPRVKLVTVLCGICSGVVGHKTAREDELRRAVEQYVPQADPVTVTDPLTFAKSLQSYLSEAFPMRPAKKARDKRGRRASPL